MKHVVLCSCAHRLVIASFFSWWLGHFSLLCGLAVKIPWPWCLRAGRQVPLSLSISALAREDLLTRTRVAVRLVDRNSDTGQGSCMTHAQKGKSGLPRWLDCFPLVC